MTKFKNAILDYFRTLLLLKICKIPHQLHAESMCSNLLDVRETNSLVSKQCRMFENGMYGIPALKLWGCVRPRGKRHSLSHSVDDMSFDMVDHVPSNIPESSFSIRLLHLGGQPVVIRTITEGRSPSLRHVSRTHHVDLDWPFERINLDKYSPIRYAC